MTAEERNEEARLCAVNNIAKGKSSLYVGIDSYLAGYAMAQNSATQQPQPSNYYTEILCTERLPDKPGRYVIKYFSDEWGDASFTEKIKRHWLKNVELWLEKVEIPSTREAASLAWDACEENICDFNDERRRYLGKPVTSPDKETYLNSLYGTK